MNRLLLLLFALCAAAPAWGAGDVRPARTNTDPVAVAPPDRGHLQYFGFYASAMGHWNFTRELAPFGNLTWIHLGSARDPAAAIPDLVDRLREARDAGVQAVLSIEPFLFLDRRGIPRPEQELEELLVDLRARIEVEGLLDTVAMIYPKDEPFREFVRYRDPTFIEQYVTGEVYDDVHRDLVYVNDWVRLVFPEKPIGVILSGYDLYHRFFSIPENYDWVGFNCYESLFGGCDEDRSFVDHYRRLLAHMHAEQRLIAVPETWARNEVLQRADWPDVLLARLRHHYEIALSEPRFIAFVPFIWSFEADGEVPGLGLDRFPGLYDDGVNDRGSAFVAAVLEIGAAIKQGRSAYPNMAWDETEADPRRPPPGYAAAITGVTPDGIISAWAVDRALPHKNLRVQFRVYDARGRLRHKSKIMRTSERDPAAVALAPLGVHGLAYALPPELRKPAGRRGLSVDLVVLADGPEAVPGLIESARLAPPPRARLIPARF
ncbi:MAG: hypothetical protein P8Y54_07620 [Xanthomonadales bacterium]